MLILVRTLKPTRTPAHYSELMLVGVETRLHDVDKILMRRCGSDVESDSEADARFIDTDFPDVNIDSDADVELFGHRYWWT